MVQPSRFEQLCGLRNKFVPLGLHITHPIFVVRAEGAFVWDIEGKRYIDFVAGIGALNTGHNHPKVVRAIKAQLERLSHMCFQVAMYEPYTMLAQQLAQLAPLSGPVKTLLVTTGAEAVENAIKIARAYTQRPAVISFTHSFHGRTLLGMSLTGKSHPYKQNFGPFAPEVYHAPFPYEYRGTSSQVALAALQAIFESQVTPKNVAAVIIEPVAGEGGFIPAPSEFLQKLRKLTEMHGILLIADEVQTGFGRCGHYFAIEKAGVQPDLICIAKSLAGGLPLAGVIGRAEVMDAPAPGGLGGTYAGNPLACAASIAVLNVLENEGLLARSLEIGKRLVDACENLCEQYQAIGDIRASGSMVALELVQDRKTKVPAPDLAHEIIVRAREKGLLLIKAGMYGNVIRLLPPLVATDDQLNEAMAILSSSFASLMEHRTQQKQLGRRWNKTHKTGAP